MRTAACIVLGLLMVTFVMAQQKASGGSDEAALKALEERWDAANLKGDATALGAILADTFVTTSSEGKVRAKAEVLARLRAGTVKYSVAKVDEMKAYLYGDAAVLTGRWTGKGVDEGKPFDIVERWTDTFVRQNGQWKAVASQATAIK